MYALTIKGSLAHSYRSRFGRRASSGSRAAARKMHANDQDLSDSVNNDAEVTQK